MLAKQSSDNHFEWYVIKNHKFTPSSHVFPLSILSLVQIHLLYFVKPRQNRPESPANKQRALNINWVSCQSFGCTSHQTQLAERFCILKYSDVCSIISVFWNTRKSGISWVITLRGFGKESLLYVRQIWVFFLSVISASEDQSTACGRLGGTGTSWASGLRYLNCICCILQRETERKTRVYFLQMNCWCLNQHISIKRKHFLRIINLIKRY